MGDALLGLLPGDGEFLLLVIGIARKDACHRPTSRHNCAKNVGRVVVPESGADVVYSGFNSDGGVDAREHQKIDSCAA